MSKTIMIKENVLGNDDSIFILSMYTRCLNGTFINSPIEFPDKFTIDFNGSNVYEMSQTFLNSYNRSPSEISFIDSVRKINCTPNTITTIKQMLSNCTKLKKVGIFDFSGSTNIMIPFQGCINLETIDIVPESIKVSISFVDCPKLSDYTINNIINGLSNVDTEQILTLHSTVKSKLTELQLKEISDKGWTLS